MTESDINLVFRDLNSDHLHKNSVSFKARSSLKTLEIAEAVTSCGYDDLVSAQLIRFKCLLTVLSRENAVAISEHGVAIDGHFLDTFEPVPFRNVECILNSLNTGKAAGSDWIPPSFLKMSRTAITRTVVEIVKESVKTGHFPTSYKLAHVCPVPKSSDPTLATVALNYGPISLLSVLSKVLELVVHQQVTRFCTNENPATIL